MRNSGDLMTFAFAALIVVGIMASCGRNADSTRSADGQSVADTIARDTVVAASADEQCKVSESEANSGEENENEPARVNVCVSEDKRITIESGTHRTGGTMLYGWTRWTIVDDNGEKHRLYMDDAPYAHAVHSLRKTDGTTYYIVSCSATYGSKDGSAWVDAYRIVGDSIQMVSVIDGGRKTDDDDFLVSYNIPAWYFLTSGAGYDWMFEYDAKTRNLYVPLAQDVYLTDHYRVWHFNGNRFVDKGIHPHKDLHASLHDYTRLAFYCTTKDYIVRVDNLNDELRYASWRKPKTMADEPNLVIHGGTMKIHRGTDSKPAPCSDFRFVKDGIDYIVRYCELGDDGSGHTMHRDYLLVKQADRVLLKQELDKNI